MELHPFMTPDEIITTGKLELLKTNARSNSINFKYKNFSYNCGNGNGFAIRAKFYDGCKTFKNEKQRLCLYYSMACSCNIFLKVKWLSVAIIHRHFSKTPKNLFYWLRFWNAKAHSYLIIKYRKCKLQIKNKRNFLKIRREGLRQFFKIFV